MDSLLSLRLSQSKHALQSLQVDHPSLSLSLSLLSLSHSIQSHILSSTTTINHAISHSDQSLSSTTLALEYLPQTLTTRLTASSNRLTSTQPDLTASQDILSSLPPLSSFPFNLPISQQIGILSPIRTTIHNHKVILSLSKLARAQAFAILSTNSPTLAKAASIIHFINDNPKLSKKQKDALRNQSISLFKSFVIDQIASIEAILSVITNPSIPQFYSSIQPDPPPISTNTSTQKSFFSFSKPLTSKQTPKQEPSVDAQQNPNLPADQSSSQPADQPASDQQSLDQNLQQSLNQNLDDSLEDNLIIQPPKLLSLIPDPSPLPIDTPIHIIQSKIIQIKQQIPKISSAAQTLVAMYGRPPLITRSWLPITLSSIIAIVAAYTISPSAIIEYTRSFASSLSSTISSFLTNWIIVPIKDVIKTIHHDETHLNLTSSESLATDLASLERMVTSYAIDNNIISPTDTSAINAIVQDVRSGNLSVILTHYEQDIKTPIKSSITGSLIRCLFIQLQKAKLDTETAVSYLNKLLRSNELNIALVAVIPAITISYTMASYLVQYVFGIPSVSRTMQSVRSLRYVCSTLRDIERSVMKISTGTLDTSRRDMSRGVMLFDVYHVMELVSRIPRIGTRVYGLGVRYPGQMSDVWVDTDKMMEDVRDLEELVVYGGMDNVTVVVEVIQRIWRTHGLSRFV